MKNWESVKLTLAERKSNLSPSNFLSYVSQLN